MSEINKLKLHRMNFFTDAVLAIIMTLLVIELHLPALNESDSAKEMLEKLREMIPHFGSFLLCFLIMGNAWLGLNTFYSSMDRFDATVAVLVVMMMLPLSLMPFAATLIGSYFYNPMSYLFLGAISLVGSVFQTTAVFYISKKKLLSKEVDLEFFEKKIVRTIWVFPAITILIIALAFVSPLASFLVFMLMQIISIIGTRMFKMLKSEHKHEPK